MARTTTYFTIEPRGEDFVVCCRQRGNGMSGAALAIHKCRKVEDGQVDWEDVQRFIKACVDKRQRVASGTSEAPGV